MAYDDDFDDNPRACDVRNDDELRAVCEHMFRSAFARLTATFFSAHFRPRRPAIIVRWSSQIWTFDKDTRARALPCD
jgi:hypothetical protein